MESEAILADKIKLEAQQDFEEETGEANAEKKKKKKRKNKNKGNAEEANDEE